MAPSRLSIVRAAALPGVRAADSSSGNNQAILESVHEGNVGTSENINAVGGPEIEMSGNEEGKIPSVRILRTIAAGLDEIEAHFVWEGIAIMDIETTGEPPLSDELAEATDEGSVYEESFNTPGFDREDVEIAVDEFLSRLFKKGMIRKDRSGTLPLFSEVLEQFFGEQHQTTKAAQRFEERIEGYFGRIDYESMKSAYDEFSEIQRFIKKELEASQLADTKGLFE